MRRVRKVVDSLPTQTNFELFTEEEERVSFEEYDSNGGGSGTDKFEVLTDERFPGQFRVAGNKIEKVVETMNWDYYESVERFQRILDAQGISEELKASGAHEGDLVMIGEWDFTFYEKRNQWLTDLGVESIKPKKRPSKYDD